MSTDKHYGDWEKRIATRPYDWRWLAAVVLKGVLVGVIVVLIGAWFG